MKTASNAIYFSASYGPTFGSGHDLHISAKAGESNGSYSNLGSGYNAKQDRNFLAGSYNFKPKEYEVFQLKKS